MEELSVASPRACEGIRFAGQVKSDSIVGTALDWAVLFTLTGGQREIPARVLITERFKPANHADCVDRLDVALEDEES